MPSYNKKKKIRPYSKRKKERLARNQNQISPAQRELLLKMAGKQLHIDPQALRRQLENGDLSALGNQQQQIQQQMQQLLNDPQKMQELLNRLR